LTPSRSPNIPPSSQPRIPRREEFDGCLLKVLKTAGPTKAEVFLVDVGEGPVVVKDFGRRSWWVRLIGRAQVSRECRAYRRLGSLPGFVRLAGRIDAHALALEWIDGDRLADSPGRQGRGEILFARLCEIVESMHQAGMMHLDLRGRDNVLLGADDGIYILDLASAVWFRPDGWKRLLDAGPYTEDEEEFLRRYRFWRALWIFNPKRPRAPRERDR